MTGGPVDTWLADLRTAALVGSGRREAADPPAAVGVVRPEPAASREHRLLDGAALADALLRTGRRLGPAEEAVEPAPPETRPEAGPAAAQLARLLLTQPPVSRPARDDLLVAWLRAAEAAGRRVPPALLPLLLAHAATRPEVAAALGGTTGERGRWLAALNTDWEHLARPGRSAEHLEDGWADAWPQLPTTEAVAVFGRARLAEPAAARRLLDAQWDALAARTRAECTRLLAVGLDHADEPLLERALDDRSKAVRESAWSVLDRLPTSARARRMADRLRPLVHVRGTLRRTLEVDVPDDPDESGVRDGLVTVASGGVQPRTQWLASIVRGAPLATWTELSGRDPAATLRMLQDESVLTAIASTVLRRGDGEWAGAFVALGSDEPGLLALLPADERSRRLAGALARSKVTAEVREALHREPRPWTPELGRAVLAMVARAEAGAVAPWLAQLLPTAMPVELGPDIDRAVARLDPDSRARKVLAETLQIHAFRTSITEAFR